MTSTQKTWLLFLLLIAVGFSAEAGPYTEGGINGYIGDDWRPADPNSDPDAVINPIFKGWATGYTNYLPADSGIDFFWDSYGEPNEPDRATGPATGQYYDTVSLGELSQTEILLSLPPGEITMTFSEPNIIQNGAGYDFAVFENGFTTATPTPGGTISGSMFCELAYVEVSSDGNNFIRFPSVSLNPGPPQTYGTIEISNIHQLAGKHPNSQNCCYGTAFDLDVLADNPLVLNETVDLDNIRYVRIVDIPGCGDSLLPSVDGWYDEAMAFIDPDTWPSWDYYNANHPVFDAWPTYGTGGFDLDAIGVLKPQQYSADINLDGRVNLADFVAMRFAWQSHFENDNWVERCDLDQPEDYIIDILDLTQLCNQWLQKELWRQ